MDVLTGGSGFLGKTEVIIVEAAVFENTLSNTFFKVVDFMNNAGYRLFDIVDLNRPINNSDAYLQLVELAFVLRNGTVDSFYSANQ